MRIGIEGRLGKVKIGNPGRLNEINGSLGIVSIGIGIRKPKLKLNIGSPGRLGSEGRPKENIGSPMVGRVRIGSDGGNEKVNPPN